LFDGKTLLCGGPASVTKGDVVLKSIDPAMLCGTNFSYHRFSFERFLDDMVTLDLRKVEIWGVAPHLHVDHVSAADLKLIKRQLSERDLKLVCFTPEQILYPVNIASAEIWLRERSLAFFRRSAEIASEFECPYLFLTSGAGYQDQPQQPAWERSVESLRVIADHAGRLGVTGVLEALQPRESNLVLTIADLQRMLTDVGSPRLKVALDTVAMAVAGETVADYMKAFGGDVLHAHFIDGAPAGHLAWGDGTLPMETYLRELAEADYAGHLSFEFAAARYALDPTRPVRQCVERVRAALAT
jgi:fructoselysine 3-epimerase